MTEARPDLPVVTDERMREGLATTRDYAVVLLHAGPAYESDDARDLVWEHGRRNFALREAGLLSIVCPVLDTSALCGVGIFSSSVEETARLMADDPAVLGGVFTFEVHPVKSFPGDSLPG